MQLNYEAICWIEKNNLENLLFFEPLKFGQSLMKQYVMWIWQNKLNFDLTLENRLEYLSKCHSFFSENVVLDILNSEMSKEEQSIIISFYYLKEEEIKEIYELMDDAENEVKKLYEEEKENYHLQKSKLLETLKDPKYLKNLVNISFEDNIKVTSYISLVDRQKMSLHYEENQGVILVLGYEFELENRKTYNHEDILIKLKALGDETRLNIVELILEKYMSASELSQILGLTIPTIAHHLKVLVSASIISSFIENEGGSKVSYKIYNLGIEKLIENINCLNSGGIK